MKKTIYSAVLLLGMLITGIACFAQDSNAFAKTMTDKMKDRLPLTDSIQYQKMYDLNLKYAARQGEVFTGSGSKLSKFKSLKSLQQQKSREAKAMLTKEQYKNYEAVVEEMKEKMRERFKEQKNN